MNKEGASNSLRVIDAHVHLFPERLFQAIWKWFAEHGWEVAHPIQAEEAVAQLKALGIERFFVLNYAHKAGMSESLNRWTHEFCRSRPEAVPFGAIHYEDDPRLLNRCFREYRFHGIKFHSHVAAIRPDDERMFPIYEKLIEHDRLIVLHAGNGPSLRGYKEKTKEVSGARFVKNLLKRFPKLKLIVPHLGADEFDLFFDLMEEFPSLRMDTTMTLAGWFPVAIPWEKIERCSDRILYGSDFPNIPYEIDREVKAIRCSGLTPKAQERILYRNAHDLLEGIP